MLQRPLSFLSRSPKRHSESNKSVHHKHGKAWRHEGVPSKLRVSRVASGLPLEPRSTHFWAKSAVVCSTPPMTTVTSEGLKYFGISSCGEEVVSAFARVRVRACASSGCHGHGERKKKQLRYAAASEIGGEQRSGPLVMLCSKIEVNKSHSCAHKTLLFLRNPQTYFGQTKLVGAYFG